MYKRIIRIFNDYYHAIFSRLISKKSYEKEITRRFNRIYLLNHRRTWNNTFWFEVSLQKCPLDLWIYQEIIFKLKPNIIIECGTYKGGSAFYLASLCDLMNNGKIITIDIEDKKNRPTHKRIQYLLGSSTSVEILKQVKREINENDRVMVILDSNHKKDHVLNELKIYSSLISIGSYIIVEDTILDNNFNKKKKWEGPTEAVKEFLKENKDFIIDKTKEKFFMTLNPNGYLKKIR